MRYLGSSCINIIKVFEKIVALEKKSVSIIYIQSFLFLILLGKFNLNIDFDFFV